MKIYGTAPFDKKLIQELGTSHEVIFDPWSEDKDLLTEEELHQNLKENGAEIYICESEIISEKVLAGLTNLKMVCVCRAGVTDVDLAAATKHGVYVTNTPGRNANAVAELTVALLVMLSRYMNIGERILRAGEWEDDLYFKLRGIELYGRTLGLVGFGAVPRQLTKKLSGFEMNILAYDPFVSEDTAREYGVKLVDIETLIKESDFVSNHLPVTEDTKKFFNTEKIGWMKETAFFINTARGATVDEDAIVEALKNKSIKGAAFDVYNHEPITASHPLIALDNVVLMPHLGGSSLDVVGNHSRLVMEDIDLYAAGKPPKHLVNPEVLKEKR